MTRRVPRLRRAAPLPPLAPPGSRGPVRRGEPVELTLPDASVVTVAPGSATALVGSGVDGLLAQLEGRSGVALMLADAARPLHGGLRLGTQIADALGGTRRAARDRATDLLEAAEVPDPHLRVHQLPTRLSAVDRQRAQLALALANAPVLLAAEDPLAGLSESDAAGLAATITRLRDRLGMSLVITADGPERVGRLVREILVLEGGRVIERRRRQAPAARDT